MILVRPVPPVVACASYLGPLTFQHTGIPTFDECREMIRQRAWLRWQQAGCPEGDGVLFWLEAEKELFGSMEPSRLTKHLGYRIYIRNETLPKYEDFYFHHVVGIVTPHWCEVIE